MADQQSWAKDPVITVAVKELVRRGLDPQFYVARVTDAGDVLIVVFRDRALPPNSRGVASEHPTLEVEINARDKSIIKSYFAR